MDKSQDKIDWVDEQDNVLGEVTRGQAHKEGLLHRIAVVYPPSRKTESVLRQAQDGERSRTMSSRMNAKYFSLRRDSTPDEARGEDTPTVRSGKLHLINDKGQILVQDRVDGRLDHSSSGHVDAGENYLDAAKRELKEELGVSGVELEEIGLTPTANENYPGEQRNHIFKVFSCHAEPGELDKEEVKGVYWEDPRKIYEDMIHDTNSKYAGGFIATLKLFLEKRR